MKIYLIGFMGSGKSTVGKALAKELGYKFIDTDEEIERETGLKISEIFKKYGEKYFRELEKKKIKEISRMDNVVVATGGGLPVKEENIKIMKDTGKVVWLRIDFDTFLSRTAGDENRPLLKEGLDELKKRFQTREDYYSKADIVIDGTKAVDDIVKEIKEKIE